MKFTLNDYIVDFNEEYIGSVFTSKLISTKYKMQHLEVTPETLITVDDKKYKFSEFKHIDKKTIEHEISNITEKSYKLDNIVISTRYNYDNIEEITFIIIEDQRIIKSLSEPIHKT